MRKSSPFASARASRRRRRRRRHAALADAEWGSIDPVLLEQMTDRRIEATTGLATAGHRYAGQHKQATAAAATAPAEDGSAEAAPAAVDADADAAPAAPTASSSGGACAKRVMRELRRELPKSLDLGSRGSMFLRFDDEQLQYMRVLITGVEGTPYANGVFLFDVFCPADYPNVHPLVTHVTPGATAIKGKHTPGGFSPNLHADSGKVCLSLLGTWAGLGWKPGKSNIYQVLSSIQWMILAAEEPYYMEPGNGGWEGTAPPPGDARTKQPQVVWYRELVEYATMKIAILRPLEYCAAAVAAGASAGAGAGAGAGAATAGAGEGVAAATEPEMETEKSKSSTTATSENAIFGAFLPVLVAHFRSKRKSILATLHGWIARDGTTKEHRARLEELVPQLQAAFGRFMGRGAAAADLNVAQQQVEHVLATMQALDVLREAAAKLGAPRAPVPRAPAAPGVQELLALQRELHEAEQSLAAVARPDPPTPPSSPALGADAGACAGAGAGGGGGCEDEDEDEVDDSPFGATEQHKEHNDY
jgi:ubiquitin-protein ligase